MKGKILRVALAAALSLPLGAQAAKNVDIKEITDALRSIDCYRATVSYTVTLPQAEDDVRYSIGLESMAAEPADTLSPVNYVIDWTFKSPAGQTVSGFSAYYDGNHFRYRGDRLQEYHAGWDLTPFASKRQGNHTFHGVQRSVQFANLLPGFIALDLDEMAADTATYTITRLSAPQGRLKLRAVMTLQGVECMSSVYTFATPSMLPLEISVETNVGSISEQSMEARYVYDEHSSPCQPITEVSLAARWPEPFEKFRESNFSVESLKGSAMPGFTLPTADGRRVTHVRGEEFGAPAMIVLLDPSKGFAAETVKAVRQGADKLPYEPEVLWAVTTTNPLTAVELTGQARSGETIGINARGLMRDCGAASLPVVILCDSSGTVRDVILGFNNDMASVVMQKMSLLQ